MHGFDLNPDQSSDLKSDGVCAVQGFFCCVKRVSEQGRGWVLFCFVSWLLAFGSPLVSWGRGGAKYSHIYIYLLLLARWHPMMQRVCLTTFGAFYQIWFFESLQYLFLWLLMGLLQLIGHVMNKIQVNFVKLNIKCNYMVN